MSSSAPFCTCDNYNCSLHPVNHDKGCNPCMEKNLRVGHVPNCMIYAVSKEKKPAGYTFEDFADFVNGCRSAAE